MTDNGYGPVEFFTTVLFIATFAAFMYFVVLG